MPLSRKRSCAQCRKAKTRCSLTLPQCIRCAERDMGCDYGSHAPSRPSPSPTILRRNKAARIRDLHQQEVHSDQYYPPVSTEPRSSHPAAPSLEQVLPRTIGSDLDWATFNLNGIATDTFLDLNATTMPITACQGLAHLFETPQECNTAQSPTHLVEPSYTSGSTTIDLDHDPQALVLTRRTPLTACAFLATRTLLGQIEGWPTMLVSGLTLPPFIHSRCAMNDGVPYGCASKGSHHCLPRSLSICASLVNMFQSRTTTNNDFVWDTIYSEVTRLRQEHLEYDIDNLIQALQALCIYIILQAKDRESLEKNNVRLMIKTIGDIAVRIHLLSDYNTLVDTLRNPPTRSDWILRESVRRAICLLYIVETLLEVMIGVGDPQCCQSFGSTPLPSIRDLWEVQSTYEWNRRFNTYLRGRESEKILLMKDFKSVKDLTAEQLLSKKAGSVVNDVMRWCEGMDQFGMVVWLAGGLIKSSSGSSLFHRTYERNDR
ncbi:hypothetical protein F5884DRAFT_247011 [Xylogone sp. PMI_703]|nr:hypothetical protein F5884DRAFT_247011 [Xylogone sp. PMI_703]